jgi:type 1 glutamine amidotransferase
MKRLILGTAAATLAAVLLAVLAPTPAVGQPDDQVKKVMAALPDKAPATPKAKRKILIYSKTAGFRHDSIPIGSKAIEMMGDKTGAYTAFHTEDESFFEPEKLKAFDAVFMMNTTGDCLLPKHDKNNPAEVKEARAREAMLKKSLEDFVSSGKGLAGVHSATDTYGGWKESNKMMGGAFVSHPWHKMVPVKIADPKSPITAAFDGKNFEIADEIYMFRDDTALATDRRYLLVLDFEKMSAKDQEGGKRKDGTYPIAWINTYGKGHCFYCSLGHRQEIYWNPTILKHYLAGIQYALGDLEANATPTKTSEK